MYSAYVELMRRWYTDGRRTEEQIRRQLAEGVLTQAETEHILTAVQPVETGEKSNEMNR